jgi:5-(carboxyamino)imidazole ribonucleotide mutase|tara:strand:+ start:4513 stop:5016 length:504 start_codon:yes stop_codon:yes gene_type:complete
MSWVAILMGSQSDWPVMESTTEVLGELGIEFEVRVSSAHRTPHETAAYVGDAETRGCNVFICGAGLAAHLAGAVAAHTTRPVIGVPMDAGSLSGFDALLSTVQMPPGIPVATVAVGRTGAKNAGYMAAQILALGNETLAERLLQDRSQNREKVAEQNRSVQASLDSE